jgi:polyisoprenoid-binding protein YceI
MPFRRIAILAAAVALHVSCGLVGPHEASPQVVAASFRRYRSSAIAGERVESFLRRRTALLIGGPEAIRVEADGGRLTSRTRIHGHDLEAGTGPVRSAALGAASAVSADGYFLTAAHGLGAGPVHLVIEADGQIQCAPARTVWSDAEHDVALLHAELKPERWFELEEDRALEAGEAVLTFSHTAGPAAGALEVAVDIPAFGPYAAIAIPHDTPLRGGHSGGPAMTLQGRLLGIQSRTGRDSLFKRRSWLVRVQPEELARRIASDRARCAALLAAAWLGSPTFQPAAVPVEAARSGPYEIDAQRSIFAVVTRKAGIASRFAHDHLVAASRYEATLSFDDAHPEATRFRLEVVADALEADRRDLARSRSPRLLELGILDEPLPEVSAKDQRKIREAMLSDGQLDAARHPRIVAEVTRIRRQPSPMGKHTFAWSATVRLEAHGRRVERELAADASSRGDSLEIEAAGSFAFTDFGIEPYSAFLGTVRNQDRFFVYARILARPKR